MNYPSSRDYLRDSVLSATPAQLVTMLYDRALLDLARAEDAQTAGDWAAASGHLTHAQDVIAELSSSLDLEVWAGAKDLLAVYGYLSTRLIAANVRRDVTLTRECADLLGPLRWAWHAAAGEVAAPDGATEQSIAVVA